MKKLNQKGFSPVEGLLVLVLVAIVAFVGFYIWHTTANTNSTYTSTGTSSATTAGKPQTLNIVEWGVKVAYTSTDTYSYQLAGNVATIISSHLSKTFGCTSSGAGQIVQLNPTDSIGGGSTQTASQAAQAHPNTYGYVGSMYYAFQKDQSACSTKVNSAAQNLANNFVKTLVPKLKAD